MGNVHLVDIWLTNGFTFTAVRKCPESGPTVVTPCSGTPLQLATTRKQYPRPGAFSTARHKYLRSARIEPCSYLNAIGASF